MHKVIVAIVVLVCARPALADKLVCGQLMQRCSGTKSGMAQCFRTNGSPRAQWLMRALGKCMNDDGCDGWQCGRCKQTMATCMADRDPNATLPTAIEGEWRSGSASLANFYSPRGGFRPGVGEGSMIVFRSNGTYEYAYNHASQSHSCETILMKWTTGRYKRVGDQVTLTERQSKYNGDSGCGGGNDAKDAPLQTTTYTLRFEPGKPDPDNVELALQQNGKPAMMSFTRARRP